MDPLEGNVRALKNEIAELESRLSQSRAELQKLKQQPVNKSQLSNDEITRYSRQMILPQVGVAGQLKLKESSVLIVGAGGLGCPAALYLASAGIGEMGIVDYDQVELNNLHRQTLHNENTLHLPKTESAKNSLLQLNSQLKINTYDFQLNSANALEVLRPYDVVLDCTDNVATRYLLNDACILAKKALVSGSALQLEGQLTVYNYKQGPCYRCIFPTPPPPETVMNCGDGGVLGAVTGVIGSLQALETIKVLLEFEEVLSGRLLLFDGARAAFRNVKLRNKRPDCVVCSENTKVTRLIDYEEFCGMRASDKDSSLFILERHERLSIQEFREIYYSGQPTLLIDVRNPLEFEICRLKGSVNIPLKHILDDRKLDELKERVKTEKVPVFLLCRRGNDSQIATKHLQGKLNGLENPKDIIGGLHAWHYEVDQSFPIY